METVLRLCPEIGANTAEWKQLELMRERGEARGPLESSFAVVKAYWLQKLGMLMSESHVIAA